MPYCDACARHWTPTSMRPDGSCPTCGQVLGRRTSLRPASVAAPTDADDENDRAAAPWHFKLMLLALVVYLAWRGIQGVGWIASHL